MTVFTGAHKGFHCSLISLIKVQKHTLKKEKKSIYVIYICYVIYDININSLTFLKIRTTKLFVSPICSLKRRNPLIFLNKLAGLSLELLAEYNVQCVRIIVCVYIYRKI